MTFYRETQFQDSLAGRIPKDWDATKLSDASLLITDGSHFSPKHQSGGYPLATVANMRENDIDIDSCYRIAKEDYEKLAETGDKPEINDVLFSKDGTVGQCIVFSQKVDLVVLSSIAIIRPNLKRADPNFLKYALQSPAALSRISGSKTGSAIKRIILRDLNSIKVALPKRIEEQKRIVAVLSIIDTAIGLADRVIAKTERLKEGLMRQLLTRGIGHTEYKDTPLGKMPHEWSVETIEGIVLKKKGAIKIGPFGSQLKKTELVTEGMKVYGQENIMKNDFSIGIRFLTSAKYETLKSCELTADDVIITMMGSIGFSGVFPRSAQKGIMDSHLLRIQVDKSRCLPSFLSRLINDSAFVKKQIKTMSQGAIMSGLNSQIVRAVKIPLPKVQEQEKMVEIMATFDRKIALERREKVKIEKVKKGLMDLLLTGKMRIKVD